MSPSITLVKNKKSRSLNKNEGRSTSNEASMEAPSIKPQDMTNLEVPETTHFRDMTKVQKGVAAFNAELPRLLADNKRHYIVAYQDGEQIAIAPNHRKLQRLLSRRKDIQKDGLFITCVAPGEDHEEIAMSR